MIDPLKLLGGLLVGLFRSHAAREAEMAFLRQQLLVLKRSAPARLRRHRQLVRPWVTRLHATGRGGAVYWVAVYIVTARLLISAQTHNACILASSVLGASDVIAAE
jgi:hypothetical protein